MTSEERMPADEHFWLVVGPLLDLIATQKKVINELEWKVEELERRDKESEEGR